MFHILYIKIIRLVILHMNNTSHHKVLNIVLKRVNVYETLNPSFTYFLVLGLNSLILNINIKQAN